MRAIAAAVFGLGLLGFGCGDASTQSATAGSSSGAVDATSTDATAGLTDPDTGGGPLGCGDNLLKDPGFEGGATAVEWEASSELFDTPICDASCTDDVGANPFAGNWWAWFGGVAQPDVASVKQMVFIPEGNAVLRFGFSVNAGSGTGNDVFSVALDEDTIFTVTDAAVGSYGGWRVVELDVSSDAAGAERELSFEAVLAGVGVTNFFVDDVALLLCDRDASSSSSSSSSSSDEGTGGTSSSSTGVDSSGR